MYVKQQFNIITSVRMHRRHMVVGLCVCISRSYYKLSAKEHSMGTVRPRQYLELPSLRFLNQGFVF